MTRQDKKESFKSYMDITHIGTQGFVLCIILIGITSKVIEFAFLGCLILGVTFIIGQFYYTGGKKMFNPIQLIKDLQERHEALLKFLKLSDRLIPRHWEVFKVANEK